MDNREDLNDLKFNVLNFRLEISFLLCGVDGQRDVGLAEGFGRGPRLGGKLGHLAGRAVQRFISPSVPSILYYAGETVLREKLYEVPVFVL